MKPRMLRVRVDDRPLYLLVKEKINGMIEREEFRPGERLPAEIELVKQLGVSRVTLREALRVLEEEGKIQRRQGVGTFVAPKTGFIESGIEELSSVTDNIERMGMRAGTNDLTVREEALSPEMGHKWGREAGEPLVVIERVRTADGMPAVFCLDHLPRALFPRWQTLDFSHSLFELLETLCGIYITYAVTHIAVEPADPHVAAKLRLKKGTPLLLLEQLHYTGDNQPVLFSLNYFRSDRFRFRVVRKRG